jgi:hypothetical protein
MIMTDDPARTFAAWWPETPAPALAPGQVWTVFHPEPPQEAPGTMVAILRVHDRAVLVVPLHHEPAAAAPIDPILTSADLDFDDYLAAAVALAAYLLPEAFAAARFAGTMRPSGMDRLRQALAEFDRLASSRDRLRALESELGPEGIPEHELEIFFESGVLSLIPEEAGVSEWADLHRRLDANLAPFTAAVPAEAAEAPAAVNVLAGRLLLQTEPDAIYRTINDLLERVPLELLNPPAAELTAPRPAAGAAGFQPAPAPPPTPKDYHLLRGLVHARLQEWDRAADSFSRLAGSEAQELGSRAMLWIHQHLAPDQELARGVAGRLAAAPDSAERLLREAEHQTLHEFINLDRPDREILRLWRRFEGLVPAPAVC